jgi:hypothetical protein
MAMKAKHAFGNLADVEKALQAGKIDSYDILFLDGDSEPKIGWIDANRIFRLVENEADFSELEAVIATKANAADVKALEAEVATKANAEEVDSKIKAALGEIECAPETYEKVKYEISDVPVGTLIDYRENEIRIMCLHDAEYHLQSVGTGGDPNKYYVTFKTYVYDDNVVGYKEHLGNAVDAEILTDFKTDEYGRRYQPTWLGVAEYDEATDTWTYYGANSNENKMIGWDYQLDLFDANGVMIASDSVRINLSNENCHYEIKPYYVGSMMTEVETLVNNKIAEVDSAYTVVEF